MNVSTSRLAPVALFVFNRPDLLANAVDSLLQNRLCADTDLYVFSDAPRAGRPDDLAKVAAVRNFVHQIKGFREIYVDYRKTNIGVRMNVRQGIDTVLRDHDRVIVLEDDLLYAPNFLDYMNNALELYRDEPRVWCVNGCSLSPKRLSIPATWPFDAYFLPRNNSYGWGIWKDRWEMVDFDLKRQTRAVRSREAREKVDQAGNDLLPMLRDAALGRVDSWAVSLSVSLALTNGLCITPVRSFVACQPNAAGIHVSAADERVADYIESPKWPLRFPVEITTAPEIMLGFLQAYRIASRTFRGRIMEAGSLLKWRCKAGMRALRRGFCRA
jgi:hypothetical protein